MRQIASYGIALAIIVVVGFWMSTGVIVQGGKGPGNGETAIIPADESDTAEHQVEEGEVDPHLTIAERNAESNGGTDIRSVRIKTFTVQPMALEVPLRGQTEASAKVAVPAETSGIVEEVLVEKGDRVAVGDAMCRLDQGTRAASVAEAEAAVTQAEAGLKQARTAYETNAALRERGVASPNSAEPAAAALEAAIAGLESANTRLDNAKAELERTTVVAKVAGIVQDPVADIGTLLNPGQPCATVVELDPIIFVGNIPEARIGLASLGLPVAIETVSGNKAEGKVSFISAVADASTRTFRVEAEIPNPNNEVRDGLTASATVKMGTVPAHLIPQSALTLNSEGTLGVRAVEDNVVVFHAATILRDTRDGVWLGGLPPSVDIITLGQEYVAAGQTVDAKKADEGAV